MKSHNQDYSKKIKQAVLEILVKGKPYPNVHIKDAEALIQKMLDNLETINNLERNSREADI